MSGGEALVMIILFVAGFATIFGIFYLRTKQNLAMVEKGVSPRQFINRPAPFKSLKWALLLIGVGFGLFLAYILDFHIFGRYASYWEDGRRVFSDNGAKGYYNYDSRVILYFALIPLCGGLGLFGSYLIEKKWWDKQEEDIKRLEGNI